MRWLIRPLVPEPEKLTPRETEYYRRRLFSAGRVPDDVRFGYVLGKAVFNGESVTWMARWCLHEAIGRLNRVFSDETIHAVLWALRETPPGMEFSVDVVHRACLTWGFSNKFNPVVDWLEGTYPNFFLTVHIDDVEIFAERYAALENRDPDKHQPGYAHVRDVLQMSWGHRRGERGQQGTRQVEG